MPFTPTRKVTMGRASGTGIGRCGASKIARNWAFSRVRNSSPPSMALRRAWSRKASRIRVVVCTPRSLVSSAVSRPSSVDSSTVRVSATRPSIFVERLSRVRETACFMRSKKPVLGASGASVWPASGCFAAGGGPVSLLPPKNFIAEGSRVEFRASGQRPAPPFPRGTRPSSCTK